jgi:hypothetical protein
MITKLKSTGNLQILDQWDFHIQFLEFSSQE